MADKHTLRQFLMFRALILHVPHTTQAVESLLRANPDWDPDETKTWEAWKQEGFPVFPQIRSVETAVANPDVL